MRDVSLSDAGCIPKIDYKTHSHRLVATHCSWWRRTGRSRTRRYWDPLTIFMSDRMMQVWLAMCGKWYSGRIRLLSRGLRIGRFDVNILTLSIVEGGMFRI
jgi:hypothetical protein